MTTFPAPLAARLGRLGEVRGVRPLHGGRGGRTFAVDHGHLTSVVHLRRDVAALEREAEATARACAAGAGPELLDVVPEATALVTRWVPGAVLVEADLRDRGQLVRVASAVRALHGAPHDGLGTYDAAAWREEYLGRADRAGLRDDELLAAVRRRTDALVEELQASPAPPVLVHADLVPSNLVSAIGSVVVLDYEYAGAGDAAFDLGNLVAGAELDAAATAHLVRAYAEAGGDGPDAAEALLRRASDWAEVARHAWFVWVRLGEDLGPERARWQAWAARTRAAWAAGRGPDAPE